MKSLSAIKRYFIQRLIFFRFKFKNKYSKMSCSEVFSEIYREHLWGGSEELWSGSGSHDANVVTPYVEMVNEFIKSKKCASLVDLGCGDANVGLQYDVDSYIGVDVVDFLIDRNNENTKEREGVSFKCCNIISDELPNADLCVIRQVLQHLSNSDIQKILNNVKKYKYVLVSEDVTKQEYLSKYNIDKQNNHITRTYVNSGVYIEKQPFCVRCKLVNIIPLDSKRELRTVLIVNK